jgi:hypothetical protein
MPAWPRKRASSATIERGLLKVLDRSHTHVRRRPALAIYRAIGTSSEDGHSQNGDNSLTERRQLDEGIGRSGSTSSAHSERRRGVV